MAVDPRTLLLAGHLPRPTLRTVETRVARPCAPAIDAHNHLGRWLTGTWVVRDVAELLDLLDSCGVTSIVNLDGRWGDELEANLGRYDRARPGRFYTFCHVDWLQARTPGWSDRLVTSLRESAARGARGLKVWKDLGLGYEDERGELLLPDDPRIAPLWHEAGVLGLPVMIHTADPVAFFDPIDCHNERLEELGVHPEWSFHGGRLPTFQRLIEALEAIVAAHPATTFIGAHVGCYAEDLAWVDRMLTAYPNFHVDLSARIAELGRQPRAAARLIRRHPARVLYGSDCFPPERSDYERALPRVRGRALLLRRPRRRPN